MLVTHLFHGDHFATLRGTHTVPGDIVDSFADERHVSVAEDGIDAANM